jgi:geranylgeranyl diphosphate synthase type II
MPTEGALELKAYLKEKKAVVDAALQDYFPQPKGPAATLTEAMHYSLFAGGKRLRPILCIAGAEAVKGIETDVLQAACALECIHTYSLIHDDLPLMDNDDLRRGKPTSHKVFGEATALLAGDALLTEAFKIMATTRTSERIAADRVLRVICLIAGAAGYRGMVGGQLVDIQSEGKAVDLETVQFMHLHKTAALIAAAVTSGMILAGGGEKQIKCIRTYGEKIGLAFQISDDILDLEGDSQSLGKMVGADLNRGKATYPALVGLPRSKEIQSDLVNKALQALNMFGAEAQPLRLIGRYIIERKK